MRHGGGVLPLKKSSKTSYCLGATVWGGCPFLKSLYSQNSSTEGLGYDIIKED
jgi:hypothetical protein